MKLQIKDDLIFVTHKDRETLMGYLMDFKDKGIYCPECKVIVTPEQASLHNKKLSQIEIESLDKNCQIGQKGCFYYFNGAVRTFTGELVSSSLRIKGKSIIFYLNNKTYRGILRKDCDLFTFKRIK